ncbi:MAG: EAL domain-containing protein [Pseudomonadota bacterium]
MLASILCCFSGGRFPNGWLLMLALAGWAPALAAQQPAQTYSDAIQVMASYHRGSPWSDELVDRVAEAVELLEWPDGMHVDYLDARRLAEPAAFEIERRRLEGRAAVAPASRLLLIDDAALRFYLSHTEALGNPPRVVAIGINDPELQRRAVAEGVKLIITRAVERQSLAFLKELFGEPLPLLVLGDSTGSGRHLSRTFLSSVESMPGATAERVLWEWTPEKVREALPSLPDNTLVYLVEGQTTGAADLHPEARQWLTRLADEGIRVFCHLPYQVRLGCAGGALLDTRRLSRLAVESLISPAFEALPPVQEVGAERHALHAAFYQRLPEARREEVEWLGVEGSMAIAEDRISRLFWGGTLVTSVLLTALLLLWSSRRRARQAQRRLAIDPGSGLPTRQVLESEFEALRDREPGGWLFALVSPNLREYRRHLGLPEAQALFREQLKVLRAQLPRDARLYLNADLGVIGRLPPSYGDHGDTAFDRFIARLGHNTHEPARRHLAWYGSLLRWSGAETGFAQCRAALDDGLFRLERQGWRQPVIRVEPMERRQATRFRQISEALEGVIANPDPEWRLVIQPKVSPHDGRLCGAEILLRWRHPELGEISPGEFLPVVEILDLSSALDHWVMARSLTWLASVRDTLPGLEHLSINVNLATLSESHFREALMEQLNALGLSPDMIELEITEHADFSDLDTVEKHMTRLREQGVRLALDDFGTGHTAFKLLQRLPLTVIKMDRSLLVAADEHHQGRKAYAAMVQFASGLGLRVVAEGVEEPAQAEWLTSLGIDEVQGFLFARPLELEDMLVAYGRPEA